MVLRSGNKEVKVLLGLILAASITFFKGGRLTSDRVGPLASGSVAILHRNMKSVKCKKLALTKGAFVLPGIGKSVLVNG